MTENSIVGKSLPRKDDPLRATGGAKYASDLSMPGMLHAKILRSPYPHAKLLNIDTSKALKLKGVRSVVTGKDTLGIKFGFTGIFPQTFDQVPIPIDKVRYIGDEVAAVAAISEDIAEEALDLIDVEYEELPAVFDELEAMKPGAPRIHDETENNIALYLIRDFGEVDKAFKEADYIREDEFLTQAVDHVTMEPYVAVSDYDASGKLTVWASHQSPYTLHRMLQMTLGLKESQIRVIKPYMGGGFGEKAEMTACEFCSALLSIKTGKPVRLMYTREEMFSISRLRHPFRIFLKTGAKRDGQITAAHLKIIVGNGAYNGTGLLGTNIPISPITTTYKIPNVKYEGFLVYTNHQIFGGMRGHAHIQTHFAIDSQLDFIARDLGMDPIDIRLKNAATEGYVTAGGAKIGSCGFTHCLNEVRKISGWDKIRKEQPDGRGIGVGTMSFASGAGFDFFGVTSAFSAATVRLLDDGTVSLLTGASDIGQGSDDTLAQMVAETLGVHLEDIRVTAADTEITPVDFGSYSSRCTFMAGSAVTQAATEAKQQLFEVIAEKLEANVEDLEAKDRKIYVKGSPEKGMGFTEAVNATQTARKGMPIIGKGHYYPENTFNLMEGTGNISPAFSFGAYAAEINVDQDTGRVDVVNFYAVHDCGRAINPMRVEGQLEGSIQMGLGYALSENCVLNQGHNMNPSLLDYKFPTAADMPTVKAGVAEEYEPSAPFGAKEAGEGTTVPVAPAIANAVYHATGVVLKDLPLTPERVWKALQKKK